MAHSIKGASAQFGAIQLSQIAGEIELFGEKCEFEKAMKLHPKLKDAQIETAELMQKNL